MLLPPLADTHQLFYTHQQFYSCQLPWFSEWQSRISKLGLTLLQQPRMPRCLLLKSEASLSFSKSMASPPPPPRETARPELGFWLEIWHVCVLPTSGAGSASRWDVWTNRIILRLGKRNSGIRLVAVDATPVPRAGPQALDFYQAPLSPNSY